MDHSIVRLVNKLPQEGLDENDVGVVRDARGDFSDIFFLRKRKVIRVGNSDFLEISPLQYGDQFDEKICNVCHRILKTEDFDLNQNGKNNRPVRRPSCKDCRKGIDGMGMSASERRKWQSSKPYLTDFECPICKKVTIAGLTAKVVLNHNHETGRILGWICDSCNTGLGRFKDDVGVLREAIRYLETH